MPSIKANSTKAPMAIVSIPTCHNESAHSDCKNHSHITHRYSQHGQ